MLGGLLAYKLLLFPQYRLLTKITLLVLVLGSTVLVWSRNMQWKDKLTLMTHDMPYLENSAQAHALLANAIMASLENTGNMLANEEALNEAAQHFERTIQIYPYFLNWHFDLGRVYFIQADYAKAKEAFLKAVDIDNSFSETYAYLLDVALMEGNPQDVVVYSNRLLEYNPNDIQLLLHLSTGYYFTQEYDSVLNVNNRIIAIDSAVAEAHLNMAYAYIALDKMDEANLCFLKGQSLNPNLRDVEILAEMLDLN